MRTVLRRCALLAIFLMASAASAACGAGDSLRGAPQPLIDLLSVMPADTWSRGLYYTDRTLLEDADATGFATALPLGAEAAEGLGFSIDDAEQILETGDPPSILLRGAFDPEAITEGFESMGYTRDDAGGWLVFRRSGDLPSDAPLATVGIPAAALRGDVLFLGGTHELPAVTGRAVALNDFDWVARLAQSVGPTAAAVALGPPPQSFETEAARAGTDVPGLLSQAGVNSALPEYMGFAIGYAPRGEAATNGIIALAYGPGAAGRDPALNLAVRVNVAHLLGDSSLRGRDALEGGAPRWIPDDRIVYVPVAWTQFDGEALQDDLRQGRLLFLAPLPEQPPAPTPTG